MFTFNTVRKYKTKNKFHFVLIKLVNIIAIVIFIARIGARDTHNDTLK